MLNKLILNKQKHNTKIIQKQSNINKINEIVKKRKNELNIINRINKIKENNKINNELKTFNNVNNVNNVNKNVNRNIKDNKMIFNKLGIYTVIISESLVHLERIKHIYNLNYNYDIKKPVLFFGMYSFNDFNKLIKHRGEKYVLWAGSDTDNNIELSVSILNNISKLINVKHLALSKIIFNNLLTFNIKSSIVEINLVDTKLFKPVKKHGNKRNKIFIYNGFTKGQEDKYGKDIYQQVMNILSSYEYILSNELNLSYEKMPEIYEQCFIGLRLTKIDGNANMVQELEAMKIPCINNTTTYGLKWKTVDDIINIINNIKKNNESNNELNNESNNELINKSHNETNKSHNESIKLLSQFNNNENNCVNCYYEKNINNDSLIKIYKNIDLMNTVLKKYKKILFICSDYPSYGGAASNCYDLINSYSKTHLVYGVFYLFYDSFNKIDEIKEQYETDNIKVVKESKMKTLLYKIKDEFDPDLVILRNTIRFNIKDVFDKSTIYYFIAGIFKNSLDEYWYKITNIDKHINNYVINQIKTVDISFCNSSHTRDLLMKHYDLKTELFYFNFIPYYGKKLGRINNNTYEYNYGVICSNFNRTIKNINNLLIKLDKIKNKSDKVILIGSNSKQYAEKYGWNYLDLISSDKITDMINRIQNIVYDSYYESCSNVMIQNIFSKYNNHTDQRVDKHIDKHIKNIIITRTIYTKISRNGDIIKSLIDMFNEEYKYIRKLNKHFTNVYGLFYVSFDNIKLSNVQLKNIYFINVNNITKNNTIKQINPDIILSKDFESAEYIKIIYPLTKLNIIGYDKNIKYKDPEYIKTIVDNIIVDEKINIIDYLKSI